MSEKKKQFRLRGKKLFFTYPQLDKNIEFIKDKALEQLESKLKYIEYYLIAEEKHEDGGIHLHCFFELKTPFETRSINFFDLTFDGVSYHGNYQVGKRKNSIIEYLVKDTNYITNMTLPVKNGKLLKPDTHLFEICSEHGFQKSKEALYEYYPDIAMKRGGTVLRNLATFSKYSVQQKSVPFEEENIFPIQSFDQLEKTKLQEIFDWIARGIDGGFHVTLVLHGPSGTGKTRLAKSIFNELGIKPLIVNDINDFKNYDAFKHKGILIDDLDAENLSRLEILNIIDSSGGRSVRVRHGTISPHAFIPKIITTDQLEDFTKNDADELIRRLKDIYIPSGISSQFNVNINVIHQNNQIQNYFGDQIGVSEETFNTFKNKIEKIIEAYDKGENNK